MQMPQIIQGGMGAGVSNWRLARAVSSRGQLGVVSGTALDQILVRRLQDGDPDGAVRRALGAFPFRQMAERIVAKYFIAGGRRLDAPYAATPMHTGDGSHREAHELCIAGNFAEVYLAREGHPHPVGINYLEKIQMPHLPSLYGAMLAGVSVVIMGAGIPLAIPAAMDALVEHGSAQYPLAVSGAPPSNMVPMAFDPRAFHEGGAALPPLQRPEFLPIVASVVLATMMVRRASGRLSGFIVEGPCAGGHNAPPRGPPKLSPAGEPIYGPRDVVDLAALKALGLPFWLAGGYSSRERLQSALAQGAAGIQVGTAFALCVESGLVPAVRRELVRKALAGQAKVRTDPLISPTGFPFKVAQLEGTLSEKAVYDQRRRVCDLGFLREAYRRENGSIGYRCPAEAESAYTAKGGAAADTVGRACLCNALMANIGHPQTLRGGGHEPCLLTLGDDFADIGRFCSVEQPDYSAADVLRLLLGA